MVKFPHMTLYGALVGHSVPGLLLFLAGHG